MNCRIIDTVLDASLCIQKWYEVNIDNDMELAMDMEGDFGATMTISLLQIAVSNFPTVVLFDIFKCPDILMMTSLKHILEDIAIKKIMHDCRSDALAIYKQFNIVLNGVIDVQCGHSALLNKSRKFRIGLNQLLSKYNYINTGSTDGDNQVNNVKTGFRHTPTVWFERPLTERMIEYAAKDVEYLINAYHNIYTLIKQFNPDDMKRKKSKSKRSLSNPNNPDNPNYANITRDSDFAMDASPDHRSCGAVSVSSSNSYSDPSSTKMTDSTKHACSRKLPKDKTLKRGVVNRRLLNVWYNTSAANVMEKLPFEIRNVYYNTANGISGKADAGEVQSVFSCISPVQIASDVEAISMPKPANTYRTWPWDITQET